jgi:hypothetical protein
MRRKARARAAGEGPERTEEIRGVAHVLLMTGAVPNTRWPGGCLRLDDKGFVYIGLDLNAEDLGPEQWSLARKPHPLESTCRASSPWTTSVMAA